MSAPIRTQSLMMLDRFIVNQGQMVAYIDDFRLMMILTLFTFPFLLIFRRSKPETDKTIFGGGIADALRLYSGAEFRAAGCVYRAELHRRGRMSPCRRTSNWRSESRRIRNVETVPVARRWTR